MLAGHNLEVGFLTSPISVGYSFGMRWNSGWSLAGYDGQDMWSPSTIQQQNAGVGFNIQYILGDTNWINLVNIAVVSSIPDPANSGITTIFKKSVLPKLVDDVSLNGGDLVISFTDSTTNNITLPSGGAVDHNDITNTPDLSVYQLSADASYGMGTGLNRCPWRPIQLGFALAIDLVR